MNDQYIYGIIWKDDGSLIDAKTWGDKCKKFEIKAYYRKIQSIYVTPKGAKCGFAALDAKVKPYLSIATFKYHQMVYDGVDLNKGYKGIRNQDF